MFDQVVFAGGGVRCTWQIGFWESIANRVRLRPKVVSAVSAGALVSSLILMGRSLDAVEHFAEAFEENGRNIHWGNLFNKDPLFPHHQIYRDGMCRLFEGGFERLCATTELRIAVSHSPSWLNGPLALIVGAGIDYSDTYLTRSLHPNTARRLGYRQLFHSVRDCADHEALQRLILSSSCTPPLTPRQQHGGLEVLDGGIVDSVPVGGLDPDPGRVLILLTRNYPQYPSCFTSQKDEQLWIYVQPSRPLPISVWDFANPQGLWQAFDAGYADGEAFLAVRFPEGSAK
ncbi:patatin-like phospholipase family protein [Microbulbifer echini]|uniref:Patatin-like phospholipase family protein n=1 Tax=Microbulbifer echini TaxID=1529067 RepID=A0ABV4NSQ7_9GAMM|nr:patatin-like phospholipase family protein [uncultured Microbulbifer sp.]